MQNNDILSQNSGRKINATPYDQNMFDLKDYTAW